MVKNKKSIQSYKQIIYILSAVIAIMVVALLISLTKQNTNVNTETSGKDNAINISLGSYQYDFQGAKPIKLSDENVTSLDEFLTAAAKKTFHQTVKNRTTGLRRLAKTGSKYFLNMAVGILTQECLQCRNLESGSLFHQQTNLICSVFHSVAMLAKTI